MTRSARGSFSFLAGSGRGVMVACAAAGLRTGFESVLVNDIKPAIENISFAPNDDDGYCFGDAYAEEQNGEGLLAAFFRGLDEIVDVTFIIIIITCSFSPQSFGAVAVDDDDDGDDDDASRQETEGRVKRVAVEALKMKM